MANIVAASAKRDARRLELIKRRARLGKARTRRREARGGLGTTHSWSVSFRACGFSLHAWSVLLRGRSFLPHPWSLITRRVTLLASELRLFAPSAEFTAADLALSTPWPELFVPCAELFASRVGLFCSTRGLLGSIDGPLVATISPDGCRAGIDAHASADIGRASTSSPRRPAHACALRHAKDLTTRPGADTGSLRFSADAPLPSARPIPRPRAPTRRPPPPAPAAEPGW